MSMKAMVLAAVSTGVAAATFVGLNLMAPITHTEEVHAEGITADQVFSGTLAPVEVAQADLTTTDVAVTEPASSPAVSQVEGGSCSGNVLGESGQPVVVAAAGAPAGGSDVAPAAVEPAAAEPVAASEPAAAPAFSEPAAETAAAPAPALGGSCSGNVVGESGQPVVVKAAGLPDSGDPAPAQDVAAAPAPEAVPEPAPAVEPAPAPEPVAAPVAAEPAPAPAPKPAAKPKPKPAVAKKESVPADAKKAWWPAKQAGKLNLTYAGEAAFTKAIVLLFDGQFDNADSANANIKVTTRAGKAVDGQWMVAKGNPAMLLFNVPTGVYKVEVGSGLSDKGNRAISAASGGLIYVP